MVEDGSHALSVFYWYAQEDMDLCNQLDKHLQPLKQRGWILTWHHQDILPGTQWMQDIHAHLQTAEIILLLVSPDFISSEYFDSTEMQEALKRHQTGSTIVIPVLLRPIDWRNTSLSILKVLPSNGTPITMWSNQDDAFDHVGKAIGAVVEARRQWIFIVASSSDQQLAIRLSKDLVAQGLVPLNIESGSDQLAEEQNAIVRQAVLTASAILLIASPDSRHSPSVKEQLTLAEIYQRPVFVIWVRGETLDLSVPEGWEEKQYIDVREISYEMVLHQIIVHLKKASSTSSSDLLPPSLSELDWEPRNPYKGLRAFRPEESRDFFGRNALIQNLVEEMAKLLSLDQHGKPGSRLLTVIGPSGTGKSSVIMAGLLPELQRGALPGSQDWVYLVPMEPGSSTSMRCEMACGED